MLTKLPRLEIERIFEEITAATDNTGEYGAALKFLKFSDPSQVSPPTTESFGSSWVLDARAQF